MIGRTFSICKLKFIIQDGYYSDVESRIWSLMKNVVHDIVEMYPPVNFERYMW